MLEQVQQQIAEMVARGYEPGGIVMTPPEMKRFMNEARSSHMEVVSDGSGWAFMGLPLYRSWEISGPAVVSRDVLRAMRSWEMLF